MSRIQTFQVFPAIPEPLFFIETLSRNLWWSWQHDAVELFRRIDPRLWDAPKRNPIAFLTKVPQKRLEELAKDDSFLAHLHRVKDRFEAVFRPRPNHHDSAAGALGSIAYFSMEFGIHESLPLFAGGLGILAGDHLKAASDMALPLHAVGLLYRKGYFSQYLNQDGMQQEDYPETDLYYLPVEKVRDASGNGLQLSVTGPDGDILAGIWKTMIGCVPLYLLDANLPENPPAIRDITARLYPADKKVRLAQEVLLGIGGMQALAAMGIQPTVCHLNEGHSAFSSLERLAQIISTRKVDLKTALEIVPRSTVFTTHTPVAAGHDEFHVDLMKPVLTPLEDRLGTTVKEMLSWGQSTGSGPTAPLSMFVLGLRMAQHRNGVSRLHGQVARRMWVHVWPDRPEDEIPISHITNGVHIPSWVSTENARIFDRYLGPQWTLHPSSPNIIDRIDDIYDEELWRAHEMSRTRLVRTCRRLMQEQYGRRNAPKMLMQDIESVLDQGVLTIGFARRFATYKRSHLLLKDPTRLEAMITSRTHPVQFVFSGKAHPNDQEGKDMIQHLIQIAGKPSMRHRIVFLENYDPHIARRLVQGTDVWLNTPRRPFEACGTSGMKAALNGILNLSVLDGWWCEGYAEDRGWRIGNAEEYTDPEYQDEVESQALYNILENEVIPCFYERRNGGVPVRWLKMMKASMKMAMRVFCSHRMVGEYENRFYLPAAQQLRALVENDAAEAKRLAAQRKRLLSNWCNVRISPPAKEGGDTFRSGESFRVTAMLSLGELRPDEVEVSLCSGTLKSVDTLNAGEAELMTVEEDQGNGNYRYACTVTCRSSGRYGFKARVTPQGDDRIKFAPGLIIWA